MNPRLATPILLLAIVLRPDPLHAAVVRDGQVVMGTVLTVTVVAANREVGESMVRSSIEEARRWDDALTIWRKNGELAELNARAGEGPRVVGVRLRRGLAAMQDFAGRTGGAFEPAIGTLALPGVHPDFPLRGVREVLRLDGEQATLEKRSALDPGGIGKGLALDAMVTILRRAGVSAAFLDFGGSSQTAIGVPPGDVRGWTVSISGWKDGSTHGTIHLRDASVSTSRAEATDTTPIFDPRSGLAVAAPCLATVRAATATSADAWSTALVVLGRGGIDHARSDGIAALVEDGGGLAIAPEFCLEP